ncbi:MAG: hypothetical protein KGM99_14180 [Burkholderiales bacterium]|nr:hypothetical protein [Burkholderiales bacterium]
MNVDRLLLALWIGLSIALFCLAVYVTFIPESPLLSLALCGMALILAQVAYQKSERYRLPIKTFQRRVQILAIFVAMMAAISTTHLH